MAFYKRKRSSPIIPIVSLVDILTVLLIFFIVTTTFKSQTPQVRIELPDSKTAVTAPSAKARPTILTISPDGQCFVNAQPIALEKLGEAIKDAGKQTEIHIYPGVDHAFFNDERADVYSRAAAEDAWRRTLAFFRQHLR
jgi:biopolymer transport protein ExbD